MLTAASHASHLPVPSHLAFAFHLPSHRLLFLVFPHLTFIPHHSSYFSGFPCQLRSPVAPPNSALPSLRGSFHLAAKLRPKWRWRCPKQRQSWSPKMQSWSPKRQSWPPERQRQRQRQQRRQWRRRQHQRQRRRHRFAWQGFAGMKPSASWRCGFMLYQKM